MKICCYRSPLKANARRVLAAFISGWPGAQLIPVGTPGWSSDRRAPALFYGVDQSTRGMFALCRERARPFLYLDNGYLRGRWTGGPYFRITANAAQHSGVGESDGRRLAALEFHVEPWRVAGSHVLVALQSDAWYRRHGYGPADFRSRIEDSIRAVTDRPLVMREKPARPGDGRPLAADLDGCWCVVTHTSNVAVEAILAGIPAIVLADCAAAVMSGRSLDEIENPPMPVGRERWAAVLADNQWTLDEMAAGLPRRHLGVAWASATN